MKTLKLPIEKTKKYKPKLQKNNQDKSYFLTHLKKHDIYPIHYLPQEENNQEEEPENNAQETEREKQSFLEFLIEQNSKKETPTLKFQEYFKTTSHPTHSEIDPVSGAMIFYVPSSYLPPNVAGRYFPRTNTIYVSVDQSPREIRVTKHHEIYHARYGSDEIKAEEYGQRMAA